MSDKCIVCLGDLSTDHGDVGALSTINAKSPSLHHVNVKAEAVDVPTLDAIPDTVPDSTELIATIIPCGHVLHNECLTPWRERANSCPICRIAFRKVDVSAVVGGPIVSSYDVEDRQQVAELDPTMFLESADDEEEDLACQECGEGDNEDVLMYCDGCEVLCHTYCAGLDEVPYGAWFCDACHRDRSVFHTGGRRSGTVQSARRRTRGQQRRQRVLQVGQDQSWNAVWQSVWSRLNLDLDFPYDDDETSATYIRRHRQRTADDRAALAAWQSRLRVAEMQGAGNSFREIEPNLAALSRGVRATPPADQDSDAILAWSAFDAARASPGPSAGRRSRKRKSPSASPVQGDIETTEQAPKRRRTSASSTPISPPARSRASAQILVPANFQPLSLNAAGPSFLQSLLQEVEDSGSTTVLNPAVRRSLQTAGSPPATDHSSPRPSSPAGSPLPSAHSSPRAMSPSPPPDHRSASPNTLSSSIQPIYADVERATSPPPRGRALSRPRPAANRLESDSNIAQPVPQSRIRIPTAVDSGISSTNATSPPVQRQPPTPIQTDHKMQQDLRPTAISPARATMSLSAKSDIQKLVSSALKPLYNDAKITKDEYTTINRDVSRLLYDRIGDFETLGDDQREKWEKVAGEEVGRALVALKATA